MKKRRIIIFGIVLVLIVGLLTLRYSIGYFPVVGALVANDKLGHYIGKEVSSSYEMKYSAYSVNAQIRYDLRKNTIFDGFYSDLINEKAEIRYEEIKDSFTSHFRLPDSISVYTVFDADNYEKKYQKIYIPAVYSDLIEDSEQAKITMAQFVFSFLNTMGSEYNFTAMQFGYHADNRVYECIVDKDKNPLSYEDILHSIKDVTD